MQMFPDLVIFSFAGAECINLRPASGVATPGSVPMT